MAINLSDLPKAVTDYLRLKVKTEVNNVQPTSGGHINPGEPFTFRVVVTNATEANGGIALTNVRYQVKVKADQNVAELTVPGNGTAINENGQHLNAGALVKFFTFDPTDTGLSYLKVAEKKEFTLSGKALNAGATQIDAHILADPDINALFPQNYPSTLSTEGPNSNVIVEGT